MRYPDPVEGQDIFECGALDERATQETEIMVGLPGGLELGKVFIGLLHQMGEGIEFLQLLLVGFIEFRSYEHWIMSVRDLVIHQAVKITEHLGAQLTEGARSMNTIRLEILAT